MSITRSLVSQLTFAIISFAIPDDGKNFLIEKRHAEMINVAALPSGYIRYPRVETAYKIHTDPTTWPKAREACAKEGGRLAVIDTLEKSEYLNREREMAEIWVGIHRNAYAGNWRAVDKSEISEALPWTSYYRIRRIGNCVALSGLVPRLLNYPCNYRMRYACEISDAKNTIAGDSSSGISRLVKK